MRHSGCRTHDASEGKRPEEREVPVNVTDQLDIILPELSEIASRITPEQMGNRTPCEHFTVGDLFDHMVGGATIFGAQFRGDPIPEPPAAGNDLAALRKALDDLNAALKTPGAMERTLVAPFGEVPGAAIASFLTLDGMVHTWDLATATGQRYEPSEELAAEVLAFARQAIAPEMRDGNTFCAEVTVPEGASNLERLVAFTGRRV
jgi:uncharacterized protein (TIGR03086 family)